jgi:hypothetical protein
MSDLQRQAGVPAPYPEVWLRPFDTAPLRTELDGIGFASIENALEEPALRLLSQEATLQRESLIATIDDDESSYRAEIARPGKTIRAFVADHRVAQCVAEIFDEDLVLSRNTCCLTYYGPGCQFGAHRDNADTCAATMILYLDARSPHPHHPETGLKLRIHGPSLRTDGGANAEIPTRFGTLVFGRGARTWHERPRLRDGEYVTALTACFARVGSAT